MTQEEKAKAYDKAIEKLRDFYRDYDTVSCLIDVKEELANLFPELKESEDERIRKRLVYHFQNKTKEEWNGMSVKDILAWLEKQVEKDKEILILKDQIESLHAAIKAIKETHRIELEKQGEQKETLCDKCRKENAYHYCQDISALGRCAVEHEQKPAWSDKIEKHNLTDFERTLADICIGWIGEEPCWEYYIKDKADVLLKIAGKMFNSVQDASFEQNPAWSEEDEEMFDAVIADIRFTQKVHNHEVNQVVYEREIDWFKSLKERHTWKPSDGQLRELQTVSTGRGWFNKEILKELLEQLKKLKEEYL